MYVCMLINRR